MTNTKGHAMKDLPDIRAKQSISGFWVDDLDGDRLTLSLGDNDELLLDADVDFLSFTRGKAEQLAEALRRLLAGEKIKP